MPPIAPGGTIFTVCVSARVTRLAPAPMPGAPVGVLVIRWPVSDCNVLRKPDAPSTFTTTCTTTLLSEDPAGLVMPAAPKSKLTVSVTLLNVPEAPTARAEPEVLPSETTLEER